MKNRVCERMIKYTGRYLTTRVWVTADQNFEVDTSQLQTMLSNFHDTSATTTNMSMVISEIEKLDNIAAAEVLDSHGNGILLYPDWN